MISTCPSCSSRDYIENKTCVCGYHSDDFSPDNQIHSSDNPSNNEIMGKVLKKLGRSVNSKSSDQILIKEIDAWSFTYSADENCICISTPALQSFRLKLGVDDMEDLLEKVYQYKGEDKTLRKTTLSENDIPELVDIVSNKIEEKRARTAVIFSENELHEIVDVINTKLSL